jgi:hypothetical protein
MAGLASQFIKGASDYIIWYSKNICNLKYRQLFYEKIIGIGHGSGARYDQILSPERERQSIPKEKELLEKFQNLG